MSSVIFDYMHSVFLTEYIYIYLLGVVTDTWKVLFSTLIDCCNENVGACSSLRFYLEQWYQS